MVESVEAQREDGQRPSSPLLRRIRSTRALLAAWQAVEANTRTSGSTEIRAQVQKIRVDLAKFLRDLQTDLRSGQAIFELQHGYARRKRPGSDQRRGIVVAPIRNRVLQRAILDVLQTREQSIRRRLGTLPDLVETPTSVGGIPGRGAPDAVRLIRDAMRSGAGYFVRSDISDFFTRVPRDTIVEHVARETGDSAFTAMLEAALRTDLANEVELRERGWRHYFPGETIGVPQGSSLSAWCGNLLLHDFDREMNGPGLTTIRYVDDFVVLASDRRRARQAFERGLRILANHRLSARNPFEVIDPKKAAHGTTRGGFDFLSYAIRSDRVAPSGDAKASLLKMVTDTIRKAKEEMGGAEGDRRGHERRYAQTLVLLDDQIHGWGHSFRETTNRVEFHQLDARITTELERFENWFHRRRREVADARKARRLLGVAVLADIPSPGSSSSDAQHADGQISHPSRVPAGIWRDPNSRR